MTIQVQITNHSDTLAIEVTEVNFNRRLREGISTEDTTLRLEPHESRTFNVYQLRDLVIRECVP